MRLVVHELKTTVFQEIRTKHLALDVRAVRPHLLVFNKTGLGAGTLKLQIQDPNGKIVAESASVSISSLATLNYAHKFFQFSISAHLRPYTTYRLVLVPGGGYSFSESAYIAWCSDWENFRFATYPARGRYDAPLDLEVWVSKEVKRGAA
jgi:hypothetical protein